MFVFLDNLSATLIASTVLLIIVVLQARTTEINMEQATTYMVKKQASELSTWLESDLLMLGRNMTDPAVVPFENPVDSGLVTTRFTFYRDSIDTSVDPVDTIRVGVRYALLRTGTRTISDEPVDVFRLRRETQEDGGAWTEAGGAAPLLSYFKIDMLNRDARPVAAPADVAAVNADSVRNTRLRFSMVTPFETKRTTLRQVYYGSTLMIEN